MNVQGIRQKIETEATYAGEKIRNVINARKNIFVSNRLMDANNELKDVFQGQKLEELLNKAGEKAGKEWSKMHKLESFIAKHSDKITAKTAAIATGAIVGVVALANLIKKAFAHKSDK